MRLLLDTHLLLWAASEPHRLSKRARNLIDNKAHQVFFSVASLWEIAIKTAAGRADLLVDPRVLRLGLLANDFEELEIRGDHALAVTSLPPLHRDPFDRILIAQAMVEELKLVTADGQVAAYEGPILAV